MKITFQPIEGFILKILKARFNHFFLMKQQQLILNHLELKQGLF